MAHVVLEKRICEDILDRFSVLDLGTFRMSWQAEVLQNVVERRRASEFLDIFVDSESLGKTKCYRSLGQLQNVLERLCASECLGKTKCFRMSWTASDVLQNVMETAILGRCLERFRSLGKTKCFRTLGRLQNVFERLCV